MARSKGSANLAASLEVLAGAPLDARLVVNTKADLIAVTSYPYKYIGMIVSVKNEQRAYMLIGNDTTVEDNWKIVGGDSLDVVVYRPAGSILFADKPATLTASLVGNVYYIKDDFTTTADFVEGAGNNYSAGTSIYVIDMGTQATPDIKWDVLSASIDFSKYQEKFQYGTLPSPSADLVDYIFQYIGATNVYYTNGYFYKCIENPSSAGNYIYIPVETQELTGAIKQVTSLPTATGLLEGNIVQYIGNTTVDYTNGYFYECIEDPDVAGTYIWIQKNIQPDADTKIQVESMPIATSTIENEIVQYIGNTTSNYTNGYFYKCIEDIENLGTYKWEAINVQAGGGSGGSGSLQKAITASIDVGGIKTGDSFAVGTNYDDMWQNLLDPIKYPSFTAPSATISGGTVLLETGTSVSRTITVTFNRGSISPSYGTSGYRAGAASDYSLNGGTAQAENTFTETISENNKTFKAKVNYGAGEQPKDSKGNDYGTPLVAGSVQTNTITYEFVNALWANTSNIAAVPKLALVSKTAKVKAFSFPSATVANPETFDVPANWTITALEVLNTLNNQWENCSSEFSTSSVTHKDAANNDVNYTRYTCNLGYAMGARQVRIKWS